MAFNVLLVTLNHITAMSSTQARRHILLLISHGEDRPNKTKGVALITPSNLTIHAQNFALCMNKTLYSFWGGCPKTPGSQLQM